MDTTKILRPEQLPFEVPLDLKIAIEELLDALETDDEINLDCYLDEVQAAARDVSEDNDDWIRKYYVEFGWKKDNNDH